MPNVNLEAALSFLSRWPQAHLFPAYWNTETGNHNTAVKWGSDASNDPEQIKRWAIQYPGWYFCVDLRPDGNTGLSVVDVDNKKGKNGNATLLDHALAGRELPPTLEASTPSNGTHLFFAGPVKTSVGKRAGYKLGEGLDTPGMVPVPGSIATGKGAYKIVHDRPIAAQQEWVRQMAGPVVPKDPEWDRPLCELDKQEDVFRAVCYLEDEAPESIQGDGGDHTLFKIAAKLKNLGISREKMVELLLDHWNSEKAYPPWTPEEIETKASNAYKYSSRPAGCESVSTLFPDTLKLSRGLIRNAADIRVGDMQERPWVMRHSFLRGYVTMTLAPGGVGKSILAITEAAAIATGREFTRREIKDPGPVWIFNSEDPFDELEKRIMATAKEHSLTAEEMSRIHYTSGYDNPMCLVALDEKGTPKANEVLVKSIVEHLKSMGAKLFVLDPYIESHLVEENDTKGMAFVARVIRRIAKESNCAVSLVHHVSKGKAEPGNADKSRGSSTSVNAARIVRTLYPMTAKDTDEWGITKAQMKYFVRLDDAKQNLEVSEAEPFWFEKVPTRLRADLNETSPAMRAAQLSRIEKVEPTDFITEKVVECLRAGEEKSLYTIAKYIGDFGMKGVGLKSARAMLEDQFKDVTYIGELAFRRVKVGSTRGGETDGLRCDVLPDVPERS